jgi:raffinose/stachyose/melibiose transport system permease protein
MIPVLSVVLVLSLKSGIMVFDYIMSMTNGGPGGATESIALLIYRHGFTEDRFSYSIAEAILAGIIIGSISAIQITASNKRKVEV